MSNTIIQIKHSTETGTFPVSLANGELAINLFDGKLFYSDPSGSIQSIENFSGPSGLDKEIQFNDSGNLGANAALTFDKVTGNLSASRVHSRTFIEFGDGTKQYTANAGPEGGGGVTVTNDTTTNSDGYYPAMVTITSGGLSTAFVSSTKMYYNPSTGSLNATNFNSLSDASLKEDVNEITDAIDILNKLNPVNFVWKDNKNKAFGVIAQEIENILPEVVETNSDGIKAVSYSQLIPILIQAIKDQQIQINKLKGKK
jgi:hypothetical protein